MFKKADKAGLDQCAHRKVKAAHMIQLTNFIFLDDFCRDFAPLNWSMPTQANILMPHLVLPAVLEILKG